MFKYFTEEDKADIDAKLEEVMNSEEDGWKFDGWTDDFKFYLFAIHLALFRIIEKTVYYKEKDIQ